MEFEVEVYGRGCEAYDDALPHSFACLRWSMPSSALTPFLVILQVRRHHGRPSLLGDRPGLTAMRAPMAIMPKIVPSGSEVIWAASGRAAVTVAEGDLSADCERHTETLETIRSWLAQQKRETD